MTIIADSALKLKEQILVSMKTKRLPYWKVWRELADYILPKRYVWLQSPAERKNHDLTNPNIIDGTGTQSARILAAGLMNGIASPSRPWFKLRMANWSDTTSYAARVWLDEVERRMRYVISGTNFYNCLAVYFLDLVTFGTASFTIFEDPDTIFHCQNHALGEYYLDVDGRGKICGFAREFSMTVYQMVTEFGEENCSPQVRDDYDKGGASWSNVHTIAHLIEKVTSYSGLVARGFKWQEIYWDRGDTTIAANGMRNVLRVKGYNERPTVVTRWEVSANDAYGTSPGMDALGDIKQLQHESKRKAQGLDYTVQPPMLADIQLERKPFALLPRGITYVSRLDANSGARPAYTVNFPFGEVSQDIGLIQQRIQNIFYNFLFNKVMNLQTVRSATEIDSIESERLVLLGGALERTENEGLDPSLDRIFGIMNRQKMFPPPPPDIKNADIEVVYVSILAQAQSAAGTASTERWLQLLGSIAGVWPEAREVPEIVDLLMDYARDVGVPQKNIRSRDEIAKIIASQTNQSQENQQVQNAEALASGASNLSQAGQRITPNGAASLSTLLSGGSGQ